MNPSFRRVSSHAHASKCHSKCSMISLRLLPAFPPNFKCIQMQINIYIYSINIQSIVGSSSRLVASSQHIPTVETLCRERWASISYKWSYNLSTLPSKQVTNRTSMGPMSLRLWLDPVPHLVGLLFGDNHHPPTWRQFEMDGSNFIPLMAEIRLQKPVEVGSLSHYLPGFIYTSQVVVWDFWTINSTICIQQSQNNSYCRLSKYTHL